MTPQTQTATELEGERASLDRADVSIALGQNRIDRQQELLWRLRSGGRDTLEAERLLRLLNQTLEQWVDHRRLIAGRVAYLTARLAGASAA